MSFNNKKEETEEELIQNLEDYIECLKDITESFNEIKDPSYADKEEVYDYCYIVF